MKNTPPPDEQPLETISDFILECRGKGVQLPYTDIEIIDSWIKQARDIDQLMLLVADLIPEYYESKAEKQTAPSLKGIDKKMKRLLKAPLPV